MRREIFKSILLSLLLGSIGLQSPVCAQVQTIRNEVGKVISAPQKPQLFQGLYIGTEIASPIHYHVFGSKSLTYEVQLQANLLNRFLPIVELGVGKKEETDENTHNYFHTRAPYGRIGMDYNIMYNKPYLPGYLYGGIRVGMSKFKYDVSAPTMVDPNYGGLNTQPIHFTDQESHASWLELLLGVRTEIIDNLYMGWCLRYKARLRQTVMENATPDFIPGYGNNASTGFFFTYNLIYHLPFFR